MVDPGFVRRRPRELVASLLAKLKRELDREQTFRRLFEIYSPWVLGVFSARGVLREDRRDLTQEVFLRVYKGVNGCPDDVDGFERWLSTVALNVLRTWKQSSSRLKRRGEERAVSFGAEESEGREIQVQDPREPPRGAALVRLLESERAKLLYQAIEGMPEQMRHCVLLRVGQDRTYREVATLLGLAEGTVKAHLHRARMSLRASLGAYFEDVEL